MHVQTERLTGPPGAPGPIRVLDTEGMPSDHLDDLRAQAQYARQRYQLYKARALGQRPTSPERLRELKRACERTAQRLRFAEAEQQRALGGDEGPRAPG